MYDVITIGTASRDVFLRSKLFKTVHDPKHLERLGFPEGEAQCFALGSKIEVERPILTVGGGAANAAVTFARQGLKTAALFKIGRDQSGRDILGDLRREHVTALAAFDEHAMTAYSVILLSQNGERTILNNRGASEGLALRDAPLRKLIARWAYIAPGGTPFDVMMALAERLKQNGACIAMNLSKHYIELGAKKLKPLLALLDVVSLNREEGAYLTGVKYDDEAGIFKRFDEYIPGLAVLTDGPKGVLVSDGRTIFQAGVFKEKKIIDRTGSGDAFGSGFVAALAHAEERSRSATAMLKHLFTKDKTRPLHAFTAEDIKEAIRLGSANATSVVEAIGAEPGILTHRQFMNEPRWRALKVTTHPIRA